MFDPGTKILVVDDMNTMRKLIVKACKDIGFSNFEEAQDGALGFKKLEEATSPVQLVISDWNMPNMSGLDFLKKVRASDKFKKLPFVMLTAEAEKDQVIEAVQAGVTNYIIKPFTPQALREKLEAAYKKVTAK